MKGKIHVCLDGGGHIQKTIRKYYGFLTIICVLLGFMFPQLEALSGLVPYLLAVLVFCLVVEHKISDFTRIASRPGIVLVLSLSNFIIFPLIGITLGNILSLPQGDIFTGIILLSFAPSPVVAALWAELSGGDGSIPVTTALFTMLASIFIYPLVLLFLGRSSPQLSIQIFQLLALSIFIPAVIALFIRFEEDRHLPAKNIITIVSVFVSLLIIVIAVSHMASRLLTNELSLLIKLSIIVIILILCGMLYGYLVGRFSKTKNNNRKSYVYVTGMRDGIVPLSVALLYFNSNATLASTLLLIIMPFIVVGAYYLIREKN